MEITNKTIDSLIFAEYNPRQLTEEQYKNLNDSISRFGLVDPIIVNQHKDRMNIIVGGHQRVRVAKKQGIEDVPCVFVNLPYEKERELNVRLNKNTGGWDFDILADMFDMDELIEWGFKEEELVGFSAEDDKIGLIDDDEIPEAAEPVCKLGDIWELGNHRLLCGDSTVKENIELLLDGNKADTLWTDPPYGIDYQDVKGHFKKIKNDNFDAYKVIEEALRDIVIEYSFVCCNFQCYTEINNILEKIGRTTKSVIVWDKEHRIQNLDLFGKQHEWVLYSGKFGGQKTVDGDVWRIKRETSKLHPTSKPIELITKSIKAVNSKIILDVFLGSGSTLIACEKTNRVCYGMELDPHYCDVVIDRWEQFTGNKAKLLNGSTKEI